MKTTEILRSRTRGASLELMGEREELGTLQLVSSHHHGTIVTLVPWSCLQVLHWTCCCRYPLQMYESGLLSTVCMLSFCTIKKFDGKGNVPRKR
jgi:hypothetical protein